MGASSEVEAKEETSLDVIFNVSAQVFFTDDVN